MRIEIEVDSPRDKTGWQRFYARWINGDSVSRWEQIYSDLAAWVKAKRAAGVKVTFIRKGAENDKEKHRTHQGRRALHSRQS